MGRTPGSDQRGAASMEALVLLPFFFAVWGALFFAHHMAQKKLAVAETARACAWQTMSGGCAGAGAAVCSLSSGVPLGDDDLRASRANMLNVQELLLVHYQLDFQTLFGPTFRPIAGAFRQAVVPRPAVLGGGERAVRASFSEMCGELPGEETVAGIASSAYCSLTGWCL